jgi:DNA-binding NarL/FixJ family response regulator
MDGSGRRHGDPVAHPGAGGASVSARILLADDHALVRAGVRRILDDDAQLTVVAEAADGAEALERAMADDVDLAILDVSMPKLTGLHVARHLAEQRPQMRVLILSMHDNEEFLFEALRSGASGYVLKSAAEHDLVSACHAALRGEPFLYPNALRALIRDHLERTRRGEAGLEGPLTPRETEVVKLIAEGHTSREIGELLNISDKTVERHRASVLEKLGLRDRVALTLYAVRRGLVEP